MRRVSRHQVRHRGPDGSESTRETYWTYRLGVGRSEDTVVEHRLAIEAGADFCNGPDRFFEDLFIGAAILGIFRRHIARGSKSNGDHRRLPVG